MCCEGLIEKFPQLDNCCCCCNVETGSKIIAWLGMIGALIYTVVTIIGVVALGVAASDELSGNYAKNSALAEMIFGLIMLVFLLFFWTMVIMLLVGLYKEDMGKVRLWLKVNICLFFFGLVVSILHLITLIFLSKEPAGDIALGILSMLLQILFYLYMISVVKSHYSNETVDSQTVDPEDSQ